jgi:protein-disulfide isomerase
MRKFAALCAVALLAGPLPVVRADETVAVVGGTAISRAALEAHVKPRLIEIDSERYEALREGLDELIAEQLLEKEAKARGVTVEALVKADVTDKIADPPDAKIQEVYDANKEQLGNASLDQVRGRIVDFLKAQEAQEKQGELLATLRTKYPTSVKLRAPVVEIGEGGRPARGPATAPIKIVEFSDYECPFCKNAEPTVEKVMETYGDKIRLVFRDYPLPFHANAKPAAMAAACAEEQGKFWEYHDKLFTSAKLDADTLRALAGELALDQAKFDTCLAEAKYASVVEKDMADASAVGVRGTPAFFINGRMISGAQPFEKFQEIIDEELAR